MGIFDRIQKHFVSDADNRNRTHLRNFFIIAVAGGKVSNEDCAYIENLGVKLGLSKALIDEVFDASSGIKTYIPSHEFTLHQNICEYILFAYRKGEISIEEKKACKMILLSLTSLKEESINKILDEIIKIVMEDNKNGLPKTDRIGRVLGMEYLSYLTSNNKQ